MEVFRLSREKYAISLSGKGAAIKGARWNSAGVELIYTAGNRSLAMAEVAVHLTLATLPDDYIMLTILIPDDMEVKEIFEIDLPEDWKEFPHPVSTQKFGNDFVSLKQFCVLKIPSVVRRVILIILLIRTIKISIRLRSLKWRNFHLTIGYLNDHRIGSGMTISTFSKILIL